MKNVIDAICAKGLPRRDLLNANRVNLLALAWAASLMLASYLIKSQEVTSAAIIGALFLLHLSFSMGLLFSFRRFLRELDEMEKQIQLNALATSVGITIIGFSCYSIFEKSHYFPELKASYLVALMAVVYMIAIVVGRLKYR